MKKQEFDNNGFLKKITFKSNVGIEFFRNVNNEIIKITLSVTKDSKAENVIDYQISTKVWTINGKTVNFDSGTINSSSSTVT